MSCSASDSHSCVLTTRSLLAAEPLLHISKHIDSIHQAERSALMS